MKNGDWKIYKDDQNSHEIVERGRTYNITQAKKTAIEHLRKITGI
jgi:hypothetical protein